MFRKAAVSILQLAAMKQGIAAGARGDDSRKLRGFAVKRIVAAVPLS
jgi:hypothetical protein